MDQQPVIPAAMPLPKHLTVRQWLDNVGAHSGIASLESYYNQLHEEGRMIEANAIYLLLAEVSEGWQEY